MYRFFGGKGGVGKTTCAAAAALRIAEAGAGRRVLAVSTDPAHSLGDALRVELGAAPLRIPTRRDDLLAEIETQAREIGELLRDSARTSFHWVLLPEALAVAETRDGVRALEKAGFNVAELIVNRVTPPPEAPCALCDARRRAEGEVLDELRNSFPDRTIRLLPEEARE